MFSKKGQTESEEYFFFTMIWLLISAAIGIALFWYVASNADNTYFWKNFYSKDVALTMDALHGVNGNTQIIYKIRNPAHNFEFELTSGVINVYQYPRDIASTSFFATSDLITMPEKKSFFTSFALQKKDNQISYGTTEGPSCFGPLTKDANFKQKKYYFFNLGKSEQASDLAMVQLFRQYVQSVKQYTVVESKDQADVVFGVGPQTADGITLSYRYDNARSKKMSCIINVAIRNAFPQTTITSVALLPTTNIDSLSVLGQSDGLLITFGPSIAQEGVIEKIMEGIEAYYQ